MNAASIPTKGADKAKKKPPKFIENFIEKVESALTKASTPASQSKGTDQSKQPSQLSSPPQPPRPTQQQQAQGTLGGSSEFILPKGTTIKLPDGQEFVTNTLSKISKNGPSTNK